MLSVVIPTRDRRDVLLATLRSLEREEPPAGGFELIVVDNGSADGSAEAVEGLALSEGAHLRLVRQPDGGPAAARNAGVRAAEGELILFLGDDTTPAEPGLLDAHAALHRARPEESYAVLGRIEWTPGSAATPFMHWLEDGGPQFHYAELAAGEVRADYYLYSSHLSLKRSLLERFGGFDERFPYAAFEDTELGVRMHDAGIALDYHPELLVHHDHPTSLDASLARMRRVGRSAALYNQIHPGRPNPRIGKPAGARWKALQVTAPLLRLLRRVPLPTGLRHRVWKALHLAEYGRGYRAGPPSLPFPAR